MQAVRNRLAEEERVIATGRCADITTIGDLDSVGAAWTEIVINLHVHWVPDIKKLGAVCSLDLDHAQTCTEVHRRHRSAMVTAHDALIRQHFIPNRGPVNWEYTSMDSVVGPLSKAILGFSRPTTAAAQKLKERLALRGPRCRLAPRGRHTVFFVRASRHHYRAATTARTSSA
jgi:hypothetical protein